MKNLEKYKLNNVGGTPTTVGKSVLITAEQHEFLKKNKLNLSAITRDALDELMSQDLPTNKRKVG